MSISAVLAPCSARKLKLPTQALDATQQCLGSQAEVARAWVASLESSVDQIAAQELYQGAAFSRVRRVAESVRATLFVVSAGLGLVAGTRRVPAYDLTLSPTAPVRIQARISDRFDPSAWWVQIQLGRFASPMEEIATGQGRILVALTKPYAQLIGAALAELPPAVIGRLRIFGAGFESSLPAALRVQVMPYDARLEAMSPGTRLDFSSRALAHFATLVSDRLPQGGAGDAALVRGALATTPPPRSTTRSKASDEEVLKHIKTFFERGVPSTRALRELRETLGIACEQGRFRRLYNSVSA